MLRRPLLGLMALSTMLPTWAQAASFVEGKDYFVLDKPIPDAYGTLVKVWSYSCPFCWKFDVSVDPVVIPYAINRLDMIYQPMPLERKDAYGRAAAEFLAWCQILDRGNGVLMEDKDSLQKKAKDAWYTAYHKKKRRWTQGRRAFIRTACQATGLRYEDFAKVRKSEELQRFVDIWKEYSYDIAKVQGVPAYVVHGRYLIATNSIRSVEHMKELLQYLAQNKS